MIIGYARVSKSDQSLDGQLADLKKAGADRIYREKISGVRADRPQLTRLMKTIGKGDVLVITKIDRLARSTRELLNLIAFIDEAGLRSSHWVIRCSIRPMHRDGYLSPFWVR
jgi:DNA invertase Pin-like site-specific DNA recombinase